MDTDVTLLVGPIEFLGCDLSDRMGHLRDDQVWSVKLRSGAPSYRLLTALKSGVNEQAVQLFQLQNGREVAPVVLSFPHHRIPAAVDGLQVQSRLYPRFAGRFRSPRLFAG